MERDVAHTTAPVHLWIVGILSLLWSGFGCYDYWMTRTRGEEWIRQLMHTDEAGAIMAYIDAFPIWASIGWGLGVWGGLAGSILLLARSRHAVMAFALSAIGALLGLGYQLLNRPQIAEMQEGINQAMPFVIIAIAVALFLYASAMRGRGVLR